MITIDNQNYRLGKLPALSQFHVLRRLAPVLASVGLSIGQLKSMKNTEDFAVLLGPISEVVSKMPDDEANYVIFTCLSVVSRETGDGRYAPVTTSGALMFQDLDMVGMLRLVVAALKENFEGFLKELGAETNSPSS